ncbi:MAG: hypothetical protein ACRDFC_09110 [Ignavibacteria bacterium]
MKKLFLLGFSLPSLFFLLTVKLSSQTVSEKLIVNFSDKENVAAYAFKYDNLSGTYLYTPYDTVSKKHSIISNKGNSGDYDYLSYYSPIFDSEGNYYVIVSNTITDTTFQYFFLKNGQELLSFSYIDDSWIEKNGTIYFRAKKGDVDYLIAYNTLDGSFNQSKPYDEIILVYYPEQFFEGEPIGQLGFTKDGKPYYLAELDEERFLVIDGVEQKHYSDIDQYNVVVDKQGVLTYFAKGSGKFYEESGNSFVVQGEKEYKKYDYLYGPLLIDKANNPVYIGADSSDYGFPQRVVIGDKEEKTYNNAIFNLKLTPSGKAAYIASNLKPGSIRNREQSSESFLVLGGKEGKKYKNIGLLHFTADDEPVMAVSKRKNRFIVVKGKEEKDAEYEYIFDLKVLPDGRPMYVGINYGNYEKKIKDKYFANIGDDDFGPYDEMQILNYNTGSYILTDNAGNYAYIASKIINFESYTITQTLHTNKGKSSAFNFIDYVNLYKGKVIYAASKLTDPEEKTYKYQLYYGTKPLGSEYDSIIDYKFNESSGTITFISLKGKEFYRVEMKL